MSETKACNTCLAIKRIDQFAMYPSLKRRARCRACVRGRDLGNVVVPCTVEGCTYTCATESAAKNHLSRKHGVRGSARGTHECLTIDERSRIALMRAQICRGGNMDTTTTLAMFGSLGANE